MKRLFIILQFLATSLLFSQENQNLLNVDKQLLSVLSQVEVVQSIVAMGQADSLSAKESYMDQCTGVVAPLLYGADCDRLQYEWNQIKEHLGNNLRLLENLNRKLKDLADEQEVDLHYIRMLSRSKGPLKEFFSQSISAAEINQKQNQKARKNMLEIYQYFTHTFDENRPIPVGKTPKKHRAMYDDYIEYITDGKLNEEQLRQEFFQNTGQKLNGVDLERLFTDSTYAEMVFLGSRLIHTVLRTLLNVGLPENPQLALEQGWKRLPAYRNIFHGAHKGFVKYTDQDGLREVVYTIYGDIIEDPKYAGSFNFFDPVSMPKMHWKADISPYLKWEVEL